MQAIPGMELIRVSAPPFLASVQLPAPTSLLRIAIQLHFSEAADPDHRQASFEYVADLTAEQRSQQASARRNGTAGGVRQSQVESAGSTAAGYATRSAARTDKDLIVCDRSEAVTFVTQRRDYSLPYSLPKAEWATGPETRQDVERTGRSKRQRR